VYLELGGVPFEAANCAHLDVGTGPGSVTIRIPNDWARRLGLVGKSTTWTMKRRTGRCLRPPAIHSLAGKASQ
jgi:hypothetical protein